jgi:hypothetical protein
MIKTLRKFWIVIALVPLFFFWFTAKKFDGWTHLELGAGNYGLDGYSQLSQKKTVFKKLKTVSTAKNYLDELPEKGNGDYKPENQYGILFETLDEMVARHGPVGIFHVNDLYEEYATFATDKLKKYAQDKGYTSVIVESIPGDYQKINPRKYLFKYGRKKYDSLHLKNPENSFFHDTLDGENFSASEQARHATRTMLKRLANLSTKGLYLFMINDKNFIPAVVQHEFIEKGLFYKKTEEWKPVPYLFPEGGNIPEEYNRVFFIEP